MAGGVRNGLSYVMFDNVAFHRTDTKGLRADQGDTGKVQVLLFDVKDRDLIGYMRPNLNIRQYCCTEDLVDKTRCQPNTLIVQQREKDSDWPIVMDIYFDGDSTVAYADDEVIAIEETGMYHLWFVNCDSRLTDLQITGRTIWKNPSGYLPGMMMGFLPFFGGLSLAYLVLGLLWMFAMMRSWRDLISLQLYISVVLFFNMLECSVWYFDYVNFNNSGIRPYNITVWAVVIGALRKTVSRLLILVVAMGYGLVTPTLGGYGSKVMTLGGSYAVASLTLDVVSNVGNVDDMTSSAKLILVLPVAIIDAILILWVFSALSKTLNKLASRKQAAKLSMYRQFTNVLAFGTLVAVGFIGFEMYFKVTDVYNERWEEDWMTGAFWYVSNLVLTFAICYLWAPSQNVMRYAYSELDGDLDAQELAAAQAQALAEKEDEEVGKMD